VIDIMEEIEKKFWNCLELPNNKTSRKVYMSFVEEHARGIKLRSGSDICFLISGITSLDYGTVKKHLKMLERLGYITAKGIAIFPVLKTKCSELEELYEDFKKFMKEYDEYVEIINI